MRTPTTSRRRVPPGFARAVSLLALALAALTVATGTAAAASSASEATPCWKKLINDWYDGRIDHSYEVHCYKDALKHLPQDVRAYSDAYDVISRALASATRDNKGKEDNNAVIPPPGNDGGNGGSGGGGGTGPGGGSGGGTGTTKGPNEGGGTTTDGFLNAATDKLGSDQADSVPIPLLVLAGLALLLVAAGAAGLVARRVQSRRAQQ